MASNGRQIVADDDTSDVWPVTGPLEGWKFLLQGRHKVTYIKLHVRAHNDTTNVSVTVTDQH